VVLALIGPLRRVWWYPWGNLVALYRGGELEGCIPRQGQSGEGVTGSRLTNLTRSG